MPQSQQDIIRYYGEKIKHMETQIRELESHIRELDAFEHREQSRQNLPNEYKVALHSTVAKAKSDANIVRSKTIQGVNTLKTKVNSFNFQHVNSVGGNNNIIDCVIYSPQQNGVYNSVGQSYLIGIMLYNGGTTNTTSSYAFTLLGDVHAIGCSIQNYAGNGYYLGGYATVSNCVSAGYTVGLNYFTVDGDYCVISGNTLVAPTNGGSILTIVSGSVNMYGNVITLIKDIGYFVNRTATTIQKRSVIRNNTVHLNGFTFSPYQIGDSSDDSSTLYIMNNGGINPHGVWNISVNPPASGTVYQNNNQFDIEIDLPVYATTAGTAGYVTVAKGASSTPTAIGNQYVSGDTSDTSEQIIRLRVPAGWYYEFTASGVTFGTASVFAD